MKRYGRVYNPFSGYDIYPDENGKYVKYEDVEQLEKDFKELCNLVADVKANFPDIPSISSYEPLRVGDAFKVKGYVEELLQEYDSLDTEVTHLREYTDHLVSFSKLPCLPKDLENLREANLKFAEENEQLRSELNFYNDHAEIAIKALSMFLPGGKYHKDINQPLGASLVEHGVNWYEKEIERLEQEIDGWKNKWECAVELASIAENKLEAIREYLD